MKLIKITIFFAVLGYCVFFCVSNFQSVPLNVPFFVKLESIPLFMVIIACLITGILVDYIMQNIKTAKKYIGQYGMRKENKAMKKKLDIYETHKKIHESIDSNKLHTSITDSEEKL